MIKGQRDGQTAGLLKNDWGGWMKNETGGYAKKGIFAGAEIVLSED